MPWQAIRNSGGLQAYPDYNTNGNADIASQGTVTLPLKIMTYSEVCLLRAEAALAGWTGAGRCAAEL